MNTKDIVYHKINTAYSATEAISSIYSSSKVSLTKTSDVNLYAVGIYKECYTATDPDNLKVECCRTVVVQNETTASSNLLVSNQKNNVFPNPIVNQEFTIKLGANFNTALVNIYLIDLTGKEIYTGQHSVASNQMIPMSIEKKMAKGLYSLLVKQDGEIAVVRVSID